MVYHVVMWNFKDEIEEAKKAEAYDYLTGLLGRKEGENRIILVDLGGRDLACGDLTE